MAADVAETVWYNEDSASPLTVSKPAAFGVGQILVVIHTGHGPTLSSYTAPSGWTEQGNFTTGTTGGDCQGKIFTHAYDGTEPSTWDFPYGSSDDVALGLFRITGADTTPTVVVQTSAWSNLSSSQDSPTVTPTGSDDLLICALANVCGGTAFSQTDPSGMTDLSQTQVTGNFMALAAAKQQLSSSSATGGKTWTSILPTGQRGGTISVAIKSTASSSSIDVETTPTRYSLNLIARLMEAHNSFTVEVQGSITTTVNAVPTSETFGSPTITTTYTINANGIPSSEVSGRTATSYTVSAYGIVSSEVEGANLVSPVISGNGIPSSETEGLASLAPGAVTITASSIPTSETSGSSNTTTASSVFPASIQTSESLGAASVSATYTINAGGIPSSESNGYTLVAKVISANSIASSEVAGSISTSVITAINAGGITSAESLGAQNLLSTSTINVNGIATSERLGSANIASASIVTASSIAPTERFGSVTITTGPVTISAQGIASEATVGRIDTTTGPPSGTIVAHGIVSANISGTPYVGASVTIDVIAKLAPNIVLYRESEDVISNTSSDTVVS